MADFFYQNLLSHLGEIMCRNIVIVLILFLNSTIVVAENLEEQFRQWMEGRQDELRCFDERSDFIYCLDQNDIKKFVIINSQGQEMYQIYWFDNGPDYVREGLYRIRQNDKIGYASGLTGEVIIEAQYDCAYPFQDGRAEVGFECKVVQDGEYSFWVDGKWQWIDNPLSENKIGNGTYDES